MSAYFVGVGLGGLCMHSITDRWGRKKAINLVVLLHLFAQYLIIFVSNYFVRMFSFFLIGFFQVKASVCYIYVFEIVP